MKLLLKYILLLLLGLTLFESCKKEEKYNESIQGKWVPVESNHIQFINFANDKNFHYSSTYGNKYADGTYEFDHKAIKIHINSSNSTIEGERFNYDIEYNYIRVRDDKLKIEIDDEKIEFIRQN